MSTRAELIIQDYMLDLREPRNLHQRSQFKQSSYSIWAANEIMKYVKEHKSMPTIDAIEDFIRKMDEYSCMNPDSSFIFSVAHDIAEDILDIFLAME